ncbi:4Fe-4S binding protein [Methanobrevibacter acididurans]|uniref:4Fe-4S binding protein n=1 Tax=Methanobrevibacter acididurans TaxID=120963 RepID=UPI0038FD0BD0
MGSKKSCCGNINSVNKYPDNSKVKNPNKPNLNIDDNIINELKSLIKKLGLLDIAYINDLNDLWLEDNDFGFNGAIVLTMEMYDKILSTNPGSLAKSFNDELYENFGNLTYEVSDFLRLNGFETFVAPPNGDIINFSKLGERAGLGCVGKSGLLISPSFGPKEKISAILVNISNLPIEKSNNYSWIREYCNFCGKCVKACPHNALIKNKDFVDLDSSSCVGCSEACTECIKVCPFYLKAYDDVKLKFDKISDLLSR